MKEFILLYGTAIFYMFKEPIIKLFGYLINTHVSSIEVTTRRMEQYSSLSNYLSNLNNEQLNNNVEKEKYWNDDKEIFFNSIANGEYLIKLSNFTWCIISKKLIEGTMDVNTILRMTIFGLNRKKYYRIINDAVDNVNNNNYIACFTGISDKCIRADKRYKNSVVFKGKEELFNKINRWIENEKMYTNLGIPHKLGILLWGEPGTGKSTVARVIATELNRSIYYLNFRLYDRQTELMNAISRIPSNSVVLLEDIDCIIGDRESEKMDSIFNTALNFVDGVLSPKDCVIIATTNYLNKLDKAFVRTGRFDIKLELGPLEYNEAKELCDIWGVNINNLNIDFPINPSKLQCLLLEKNNIL